MEHESLKQYNNFYASTNNSNMSSRLNKFLYSEIYAWRDLKFLIILLNHALWDSLDSSTSKYLSTKICSARFAVASARRVGMTDCPLVQRFPITLLK